MSKTISFKASDAEYAALDWLIKNDRHRSASEAIRTAIRRYLDACADLPKGIQYHLDRDQLAARHAYSRR